MKINEIVRIDDESTLIDALQSMISKEVMELYKSERYLSNTFAVSAISIYGKFGLATQAYNCKLLQDQLKEELPNRYAQSRRAASELLRWYHGTLKLPQRLVN